MKYVYTAIFKLKEDGKGYYASVPDLSGCITSGKDLPDAIVQITDAASIWLVDAEDDYPERIKPASSQSDIKRDQNDILALIQVDTSEYRSLTKH